MTEEQKRRKLHAVARMGMAFAALLVAVLIVGALRASIEKKAVVGLLHALYLRVYPFPSSNVCLVNRAQQEELHMLREENTELRSELGTIPDKADLLPARVIWVAGSQYTISYTETQKNHLIKQGTPVIYGDILLGNVIRNSSTMAVVRSVHDSGYKSEARTQRGVQGSLVGGFGQELMFQFPVSSPVRLGDRVYAVYPQQGWQFLVGTILAVSPDRSKPIREARVESVAPAAAGQKTVFLSL